VQSALESAERRNHGGRKREDRGAERRKRGMERRRKDRSTNQVAIGPGPAGVLHLSLSLLPLFVLPVGEFLHTGHGS